MQCGYKRNNGEVKVRAESYSARGVPTGVDRGGRSLIKPDECFHASPIQNWLTTSAAKAPVISSTRFLPFRLA